MKHPFLYWLMGLGIACLSVQSTQAAEVPLADAETAVANWIRMGRDPTGRRAAAIESARTVVDEETGAAVHVVRLAGGGFVVTAADDTRSPIMVSSASGDLDTDERNPLWALLRRDAAWGSAGAGTVRRDRDAGKAAEGEPEPSAVVAEGAEANRAAWAELLGEGTGSGGSPLARKARKGTGDWASGIGVTVPLTETEWSQTTHNGMSMESGGKLCYNYYTPPLSGTGGKKAKTGSMATPVEDPTDLTGNWPCGCTATAAAQLMYHYQLPVSFQHAAKFPDKSVPTAFHWSKMKKRPLSESSREAVGKLTSTIAYKIETSFTHDGSGKPVGSGVMSRLPSMLTGTAADGTAGFGWKNAAYESSSGTMALSTMQRALIPNLDGGLPCLMGIRGGPGGHAIVIDGYRFSGNTFAVHANFGWMGSDNGWYVPPTFSTSEGTFTVCDEVLYNVFPGESGSLISVHFMNEDKQPIRGCELTYSPSSKLKVRPRKRCAAGTCVFFAPAGTYTFTATSGGLTGTATATVGSGGGINNQIVPIVFKASRAGKVNVKVTVPKQGAASAKDGTATSYTEPQTVTLSCATAGADIYYTLDGSEPNWEEREDEEGNVKALNPGCRKYTGPFAMAGADATIRAVAAKDGMGDSEETEASFAFRETKSRDKFADARVIAGICGTTSFDTTGCGSEKGEPLHSAFGNPASGSVWAAWTAPHDGDFTFRLSGISLDDWIMDTQLAVYTGTSVSKLTRVTVNDDAGSQDGDYSSCVTFQAKAGTTYRIAMDSYEGAYNPGTLTLEWSEGRADFVSIHAWNQSVSGGGEQKSFSLETSAGWVLEEYSSWLRPLSESGSDSQEFSYEATANPTGKLRSGHLLFRSGEDGWGMLEVTQSTVPWVTNKAEAVAAAKASGKRILLLSGRDSCGNTQYTRFTSCEDDLVRDLIREGYVAWYSDCDHSYDHWDYLTGISSYTLPLVCVLESDARAKYRSRTTGLRTAEQLRAVLDDVVLFDAAGGTVKESIRYRTPGAAYGKLPVPTRAGNDFAGWFEEETGGSAVTAEMIVPSGATTLHARWTGLSYRVALNPQGGTGGTANVTAVFGQAMPAIAAPTRWGYDFGGYWSKTGGVGVAYYTASGASARTWNIASNATLYAKWTGNPSEVSFSFEGGVDGTASVTAEFGAALPRVVPPRRLGWTFLGYWTERGGKGTQYVDGTGTGIRPWDRMASTTLYGAWEEAVPSSVFRFYSSRYRGHFFTISEAEKDDLIENNWRNWKFEGAAYGAFTKPASGTVPLYRFYSKNYRGHFFTINEAEKDGLIEKNQRNWKYEGVAYYVYPNEVAGSVPIYRFWSKAYRHHFYTMNAAEKDSLIANNPKWQYETVAFWALPVDAVRAIRAVRSVTGGTAVKGVDEGDLGLASASCQNGLFEVLSPVDGGDSPGLGKTAGASGTGICESWFISIVGDSDAELAMQAEMPVLDEWKDVTGLVEAESLLLRMHLPAGIWNVLLWSALDGILLEEEAEVCLDFELPATGCWHWLCVRGTDGEIARSVWLLAE